MEVSGQPHKSVSTHSVGGRVGPRVGMDVLGRGKFLALLGIKSQTVQPTTYYTNWAILALIDSNFSVIWRIQQSVTWARYVRSCLFAYLITLSGGVTTGSLSLSSYCCTSLRSKTLVLYAWPSQHSWDKNSWTAEWVSPGELQCGTAVKELALAGRVKSVKVQPVSFGEDKVLKFHLLNTVVLLASSDIGNAFWMFGSLQT
jgi:hypothetical protein